MGEGICGALTEGIGQLSLPEVFLPWTVHHSKVQAEGESVFCLSLAKWKRRT